MAGGDGVMRPGVGYSSAHNAGAAIITGAPGLAVPSSIEGRRGGSVDPRRMGRPDERTGGMVGIKRRTKREDGKGGQP